MSYKIAFTKQAQKDYVKVTASQHKEKVFRLLSVLEDNPFQPPWENSSI